MRRGSNKKSVEMMAVPEKTSASGKQKLFDILEIMYKYSDEDHPLNANDIIEHLQKDYGLAAERKSVYNNIKALKDCGVDIERVSATKDGYYIASRKFEVPEIRLLIDAIHGAHFITDKKTKELSEKLFSELSAYQAENIKQQSYLDKRVNFGNEQIYYAVDAITEAIAKNRRISFTYHHKIIKYNTVKNDEGREFVFSPYALFWEQGKYYVAGNYEKFDTLSNYRLDRMSGVKILEERARPYQEVSGYLDCFDTADYISKNFMMYNGDEAAIDLICDISLIEIMLDRFGNKALFKNYGADKFRLCSRAYISDGLADWLLPYCDRCYINAPKELRIMVEEKAKAVAEHLQNFSLSDC